MSLNQICSTSVVVMIGLTILASTVEKKQKQLCTAVAILNYGCLYEMGVKFTKIQSLTFFFIPNFMKIGPKHFNCVSYRLTD